MQKIYQAVIRFSKVAIALVLLATVFFSLQLTKLKWETDARVYLPKGHPAIIYDEKVDDIFGVRDTVIIGMVNEEEGIFNTESLNRIKRLTEKIRALPGVMANRDVDIVSLSTARLFVATDTALGSRKIMETVPKNKKEIEALESDIYKNSDLFVGNIVSKDGTAAMIRAKLKEGIKNRYMSYYKIKELIQSETGEGGGNGWWGGQGGGRQWQDNDDKKKKKEPVKDKFYIAGRSVIEVTSGINAMDDMKVTIPLILLTIIFLLFLIFRTIPGILIPLFVMMAALVWTMGTMALVGVPMYTISTMIPVIIVAVGIGDSIHMLTCYYDNIIDNREMSAANIVSLMMKKLSTPLIITSLTTAIGFLSLLFAEMPPFKKFGMFAALGVIYCWTISVLFVPSVLSLLKPKLGGYFLRKKAFSAAGQTWLTKILVNFGRFLNAQKYVSVVIVIIIALFSLIGSLKLYVDSSWMDDFRDDSEVVVSNNMLNEKFDGTIFLSVVIEGKEDGVLKNPFLLKKMEALQNELTQLDAVGGSLSIVDYLKSMNKSFNGGDEKYNILPSSKEEIAQYLFLLSISGRPEMLDEVVDYNYRQANVRFFIKTDHTKDLKIIIDKVNSFIDNSFAESNVQVNLAGSANNSFIWADLLIKSQAVGIILSKVGIFILALIVFRSFVAGLIIIIPITFATLFIFGVSGFLDIPLDVSTALAACIAIGVGIDYTIHFIFRYKSELSDKDTNVDTIVSTMKVSGKAIVYNAIVVTLGFLTLLLSQFPPHVKLGYFISAYMVTSCFAALTILPLLFTFYKPKFGSWG